MTLPSHLRKKVALLVPRLASKFEGEIVATVGAIGRTLASEGHDLHDLAEVIRGDIRAPSGPASSAPTTCSADWRGTVRFCRLYGIVILSPWEQSFVDNLAVSHYRQLTPKQAATLADIDAKLRIRRSA